MALRLVPPNTNVQFVNKRKYFFVLSALLFLAAIASVFIQGINFGIDFKGGILIEFRDKSGKADVAQVRQRLGGLGLGDVSVQEFGQASDVLVRIERQPGAEKAQQDAVTKVRNVFSIVAIPQAEEENEQNMAWASRVEADRPTVIHTRITRPGITVEALRSKIAALDGLNAKVTTGSGPNPVIITIPVVAGGIDAQAEAQTRVLDALSDVSYRRVETVGPQVGSELIQAGIFAVVLAMVGILLYIWFRFEWQFGAAAIIALTHDVFLTLGFFAELGLEFNLATVAAVLTVAGYSINDTVVVFDRVRENLRKYKKMPLPELMNKSINETLSRTVLTSITTLLAVLALVLFGGQVIRDFSLALIWGIAIGTYSSICLAVPVLLYFNIRRDVTGDQPAESAAAAE